VPWREDASVIRNVCIHVNNEQPLLADLYAVPTAADAGLLCTNLRTLEGRRPVFIDRIEATFFFPYHVVRFIEIPVGALDAAAASPAAASGSGRSPGGPAAGGADDHPEQRLPVPVPGATGVEEDGEAELEIDEGFLQRIRDI
jgi:hypothetical protein